MKWIKKFNEHTIYNYKTINNVEDLKIYLNSFNIDTTIWGTGGYKTLGHLLKEIEEGETELSEKDSSLIRTVNFVGAKLIYKLNGQWVYLKETKQIFKDGRSRKRNLPYSMAEKFKYGEDPKRALIRGLVEELGLYCDDNQISYFNKLKLENNEDYPGMKSYHEGSEYLVILNNRQYKEEGYIERQVDKDIYFNWVPYYNK